MWRFLYCIFIGARRTVFPGHLSVPHHPGERWRWCGWAQKVTRLREILCVHIVLTWWGGLSWGCPEVRLWLHAGPGSDERGVPIWFPSLFQPNHGHLLEGSWVSPLYLGCLPRGLLSRFCLCAQCFLDSPVAGRGREGGGCGPSWTQLAVSIRCCFFSVARVLCGYFFLLTSTIS